MSIYSDSSFIISAAGGYKEGDATPTAGKLYNLKPDGATYPAMDVTGGGNAVSQRSDGYYQINWPVNTPRYKYINGVPSILVELQSQNLITYPRSFDNAYWNKTGATVDDNAGTGYACPFVDNDGVNTNEGFRLTAAANNATIKLATAITTVAASTYANSLFVRRISGSGSVSLIDINDADNEITLTTSWQRFDVEAAAAGTTGQIGIKLATPGDVVEICHAQPELGASASSPIYGAEGSVLTRLADELSEVDLTGIKTLIINDYALISKTGFVYNSYELDPTRTYSRIITSESVMTEAQLTAIGAAQVASTDAVAGDLFVHNGYIYGVVESATGELWLDRNLGAKRVAQSSTDTEAYGDLYQWGRAADGHEIINRFVGDGKTTSGITDTLADSDTPGHDDFILAPDSPYDWRDPQNDSLWQGVDGINNPAPDGWRLPTETEWNAEIAIFTSANSAGAYNSVMKLPVAGYRRNSTGSIANVGSYGFYWSATMDGSPIKALFFFISNALMYNYTRAYGLSVRCIKN